MKFVLVVFSLFVFVSGSALNRVGYRYGCPRNVIGCSCENSFENARPYVKVTCNGFSNVNNIYEFRDRLKRGLENYEIDELEIRNYIPIKLPESAFITDEGNQLALVNTISIKDSPNLQYFSGNTFGASTFFDGLSETLQVLCIENTANIDRNEWFRMSRSLGGTRSHLRRLILANTGIENRVRFDFTHLTNLERIMMSDNRITVIETDLTPFPNLQVLDVSNNEITEFLLNGTAPKLTTVMLKHNKMQHINKEIFTAMPNLRLLNVEENELSCFCDDIGYITNSTLFTVVKATCNLPRTWHGLPLEICCPEEHDCPIRGPKT